MVEYSHNMALIDLSYPPIGAIFNPAVGTGPTFIHGAVHHGRWNHLWIYLFGPMMGGTFSGLFFRITNRKEYSIARPAYSEIAVE